MCAYGLCEIAVPVKLGRETIGFLQTGQVMRRKPTEVSFERAVRLARKAGVQIDDAATRRAYFATPVISQLKLNAASDLLGIFADHLSRKSNQIMVQTMNAESPVVLKDREFIGEHYVEAITLKHVSRFVNTSVFHFCKVFRKCTQVTFTEFVSRTQIARAKDLLLNPNLRISEIAFAVGFQSLTHFNRMFREIELLSSTAYRVGLAATV